MHVSRVFAASMLAAIVPLLGGVTPAQGLGYTQAGVVSADPVNNTPHVLDGSVLAIAAVGQRVYVGGTFTTVVDAGTSARIPRSFLFAYDRTTGAVVSEFAPVLSGAVESIMAAPDGSSIIIGGRFRTVNGTAQRSLAMLTADGSRVSSFKAKTNGYVTKVLLRGDRLMAGGRFSTANGVARANLAAFHAGTGDLNAFNVAVTEGRIRRSGAATSAAVIEMDADPSGSRLVIIGNFRRVGGQARQQIAMIDLASGTVSGWYTNRYPNDVSGSLQAFKCADSFDSQMRDVEFSPDGKYFVVVTTGGAPDRNATSLCDTAARWETTPANLSAVVETWKNCTGGDTLYSTAITGAAVYVGGHQRWLDNCGGRDSAVTGSFAADGIGAINPTTGKAIRDWNPGRTRGVGAEELVADADGLYVGSDTTQLGGEYHARLGRFPLR